MFDNPHFCFKLCSLDITNPLSIRDFMANHQKHFLQCELKVVEMHGIRVCIFIFPFDIILVVNTIELDKCGKYTNFRKIDVQGGKVGFDAHDISSKILPVVKTHIERFKNSRRILSKIPVQVMGFKQGAVFSSIMSYLLSFDDSMDVYVLLFGSSYIGDEKFLKLCETNVKELKHYISDKDHKSMWEIKRKNDFKPVLLNERGREDREETSYTKIFKSFVKNRGVNLKFTYESIMRNFVI